VVVATGSCSGSGGGLSDTQRSYCDQWFGNVIYAGMKLGVTPTDLPGSPDMNQIAIWASLASGGFNPYAQQVAATKQAWETQHPDTYDRACAQAYSDYAPK
jgi:hypothetical protein